MPKSIAVVAYDLDPKSALTADAVVVRDLLNGAGYSAQLVHQWSFDETNRGTWKTQDQWAKYDGVVICSFYEEWNLRELIRADRPVLCLNTGYVDDLGLGEADREHAAESSFNVVNNTHPITSGLTLGAFGIGSPVFLDAVSTGNHYVDVLITTLGSETVLAAHKALPLTYFGWYRMSQADAGSALQPLLSQAANWTFSGP